MELLQFILALIVVCVVIAVGYFIIRLIASVIGFIIYGVIILVGICVCIAFLGELLGFVDVVAITPLLTLIL